jgi:iron complex transport system ATP-binding protein
MALELVDATVKAGSAVLIRDISMAVEPRRLVAVLGPNGAGKSTMLAALSGDIALTSGLARLDGAELRRYTRPELARRRAVVSQHAPLSFPLRVHEVVSLAAFASGGRVRSDAVQASLSDAGVLALANRDYTTLSGGERQRVQIARALAQLEMAQGDKPSYLLLDEPTAHLDLKHQIEALETIRRFTRRGGGALCILHDPILAADYADEIVILKSGRVFERGTALTAPTIEALYDLPHGRFPAFNTGRR